MFKTLREQFESLDAVDGEAEQRKADAYLAKAETLAELEHLQRELERGCPCTLLFSGW